MAALKRTPALVEAIFHEAFFSDRAGPVTAPCRFPDHPLANARFSTTYNKASRNVTLDK